MKKYKMKTTRPEFLLKLTADGNIDALDYENLKKHLYDGNHISYCVYTVLMDADIDADDILFIDGDGESIAIRLSSKSVAKHVAEVCNKQLVRYGDNVYKVKIKARDAYINATIELDHKIEIEDNLS